jgi:hypothetical protein
MINFLKNLLTFYAGEPVDVTDSDDNGMFDSFDSSEMDEGGDDDDGQMEEIEDEEILEDEDDELLDDDEDAESEDDDEDEDDIESDEEEDSEDGEGDGAQYRTHQQIILEQSVEARLASLQVGQAEPDFSVEPLTVQEMIEDDPSLADIDEGQVKILARQNAKAEERAARRMYKKYIEPMQQTSSAAERNAAINNNIATFERNYPGALTEPMQKKMLAVYNGFFNRHGRDKADTIGIEELYVLAGGDLEGARKPRKTSAKAKARKQKRKALAAQGQAGKIATLRTGGKRRRGKDDDLAKATIQHIRSTNINPFTLP